MDGRNWDIFSAVCLERRSIITKEFTNLEKEMLTFFSQLDVERSLKSDFELRNLSAPAPKSASSGTSSGKGQSQSVLSLQDIMDAWEKELQDLTLAPKLTEADKSQDIKSLQRKLSSRLFLLIKQDGTGDRWLFPQGVCEEGETLRQSAERVLKQHCGTDLKARFLSNAPCGFYQYGYPKSYRDKEGHSDGAKVFFYKAELVGGDVKSKLYQWRTKSELLSIVDKRYAKSLDRFILDES